MQTAETETETLNHILDRGAAYCDKLNGAVLYFVCRERIEETIAELFGHETRFNLEYDYQLIRDRNSRLKETRTLLEENGVAKSIPNAPLKTRNFEHKYVVLGPIGLLGRIQQADFDYSILKETNFGNDPVYLIKAVPKPSNTTNRLFGTIWLRKIDAVVMKIEWEQASLGNYEKVLELAKSLDAEPHIFFVSEYDFEKNGLRFPSRYIVRETYRNRRMRTPVKRSETIVTYDNYKFFTVETGVVYYDR